MNKLLQVDVKNIKSDVLRSQFDEREIDELANLILAADGLLRPLILKQSGIENYTVLDGHLEFYAAVRAREKNPAQAETVNAFLVTAKTEAAVLAQIQSFNNEVEISDSNTDDDKSWIASFDARLGEMREELIYLKNNSDSVLKKIGGETIQKSNDLLDLLNNLEEHKLIKLLTHYAAGKKKIEALCDSRRKKQAQKETFENFQDVVKSTAGFGEKGMLALIDKHKFSQNL